MQNKLSLFKVNNSYCNFLREYDYRVTDNRYVTYKSNRPYVGVVFSIDDFCYFAPLSSPKAKHRTMPNNMLDCIKIQNGNYGVVNLNNMIPVNIKDIKLIDLQRPNKDNFDDINILRNQYYWCNKPNNIKKIRKNAKLVYDIKISNNKKHKKLLNRTCNFKLLEEKCLEWKEMSFFEKEKYKDDYSLGRDYDNSPSMKM